MGSVLNVRPQINHFFSFLCNILAEKLGLLPSLIFNFEASTLADIFGEAVVLVTFDN